MTPGASKPRASVVECGGKPWRDTAVANRTAFFGLITFFPRSTAVSPMQGALASLPPHSTTLRASHHIHSLRPRHLPKRLGAAMPVHEINRVGHAELLQGLAERIDDLSG